jgi:tRNA(fMet)-specific endonuclease VapC
MTVTYLLDTNHMGAAVSRVSVVRDRIQQAYFKGHRFGTCVPVLCELEVGIQQTNDPVAYRRRLKRLLKFVRLWPLEQEVAEVYGRLHQMVKRQGKILSQVDLLLAAIAHLKRATLLTTDLDFAALPEIPTENWTT